MSADALEVLAEAGAHFVLCRDPNDSDDPKGPKRVKARDGSMVPYRWSERRPTLDQVRRHVASGKLIGIAPTSLGAIVIDCDGDKSGSNPEASAKAATETALKVVGQPLANLRSNSPGCAHLWYKSDQANTIRDRKWRGGDIKARTGYVVLWDADALAAGLANTRRAIANVGDADLDRLPPLEKQRDTAPAPRKRVDDYDLAQRYRTLEWIEGQRNDLLNRLIYACGLADDRAQADEIREWVIDHGHQPQRPAEATFRSAWEAGQAARDEALSGASDLVSRLIAVGVILTALEADGRPIHLWSGRPWESLAPRPLFL